MSCCCCSAKEAGISLAGVLFVALVAFVALNFAAIIHFLLMVLIGVLAVSTAVTAVAGLVAWRMHAIRAAPTARYHVEQETDRPVIYATAEVIQEEVNGRVRKALEASPPRGISYGFGEQSDGTLIPSRFWADGSPVRPIRHSQR